MSQMDVLIEGDRYPLMAAVERSTAILAKCFKEKVKKIVYPNSCSPFFKIEEIENFVNLNITT